MHLRTSNGNLSLLIALSKRVGRRIGRFKITSHNEDILHYLIKNELLWGNDQKRVTVTIDQKWITVTIDQNGLLCDDWSKMGSPDDWQKMDYCVTIERSKVTIWFPPCADEKAEM